jgi:3-hydroxybutyryl-CoA dehydrogenase
VEVTRGRLTSDEALRRSVEFIEGLGKLVVFTKDSPGFILNYFLVPFENDCIRALETGMGTVESIDKAVTLGLGYPMGTFRLLDIVGLDIHKAVSMSLYQQLRDPRFAPPPLVDRMISANHLGRKTGRGFYEYE